MSKKSLLVLIGLLSVFILLRLPGLNLPYYQDEWKTVSATATAEKASGLAHPPLTQLLFRLDHALAGPEAMRVLPLVFSLAAAWLLFLILRRRLDERAAFISLALFAVVFYSVWASLQIDTDGAILPFFFLLSLYFYDRWRVAMPEQSGRWLVLLALSLLLGLLVKLSFVLAVGALALDFVLTPSSQSVWRRVGFAAAAVALLAVLFAIFIAVISYVYSPFDWRAMFEHAGYYVDSGRNYLQILVQGLKVVFYLSPLILAPLLFVSREEIRRLRPFFLYLLLGFIFYFGFFDFSRGALDKYLMYLVIPLTAISVGIISRNLAGINSRQVKIGLWVGGLAAAGLFLINFLPHEIIPLYPKTEWFSRVLNGRWLMLNPFTGGSGPVGFYVSFLFIISSFASSLGLILFGWLKRVWRPVAIMAVAAIGLVYNAVMLEELFLGRINGSVPAALNKALAYIESTPKIETLITYNDIGAYELSRIGKYAGRFYAAPQFEAEHRDRFAKHNQTSGHYLIVEMPLLYDGFYGDFFSRCHNVFATRSGRVTGLVYDCQNRS